MRGPVSTRPYQTMPILNMGNEPSQINAMDVIAYIIILVVILGLMYFYDYAKSRFKKITFNLTLNGNHSDSRTNK